MRGFEEGRAQQTTCHRSNEGYLSSILNKRLASFAFDLESTLRELSKGILAHLSQEFYLSEDI